MGDNDIIARLKDTPLFTGTPYQALARLIPHVRVVVLNAGETLYRRDDDATRFFVLAEGCIVQHLPKGEQVCLTSGCLGEETAVDARHYIADTLAETSCTLLAISRRHIGALCGADPGIRTRCYFSLIRRLGGDIVSLKETTEKAAVPPQLLRRGGLRTLGWLLALVAPVVTYHFGQRAGMGADAAIFSAIFSATAVMWIFSLVDDYVPGIFALLATAVLGLVPINVILSGFASDGFIMAMSVLGLSAVIVASGLSYRLLLMLLLRLPNRSFWHHAALFLSGALLTPTIPSANARVALTGPFLVDMIEALRLKPKGRAATKLALTSFYGATLLSAVFLTAKSVNFVIFGLLPQQDQFQFQWLGWLATAAVSGIAIIGSYLLIASFLLRSDEEPRLVRNQVTAQLGLLGPMNGRERAAVIGIVIFLVGSITISLHKIQAAWLGLAILFGLLILDFLRKSEFRKEIDWPFLIYLGGMVGITNAFNYLGLDHWVAARLGVVGEYMRTDFSLFLLMLAGVIFVVRLAVPISATIVISAAVFMPTASLHGINPWVVGFAILMLGEMWFLPYQCSYYIQFRQFLDAYDEKLFLRSNAVMNLIKLSALYASIPYWTQLGLI